MREETSPAARRAQVEAVDLFDTGRAQCALRRRPEVELAVADDVVAEGLAERRRDLVADLVAARPDARSDRGAQVPPTERPDAHADEPCEEAAPARVQDLHRGPRAVRACDGDRETVRGQQQHRAAGLVAPETVAMVIDGAGHHDAARLCARDRRAVPLPCHCRAVGVRTDRLAQARAILDDARGIVLREDAEVERRERARAHAAASPRERYAVGAGAAPVDQSEIVHPATISRAALTPRCREAPVRARGDRPARAAPYPPRRRATARRGASMARGLAGS